MHVNRTDECYRESIPKLYLLCVKCTESIYKILIDINVYYTNFKEASATFPICAQTIYCKPFQYKNAKLMHSGCSFRQQSLITFAHFLFTLSPEYSGLMTQMHFHWISAYFNNFLKEEHAESTAG